MKKNIRFIVFTIPVACLILFMFSFTKLKISKDCDDVKSTADDAYSYFKKAYNSSSIDDGRYYAKKGMNEASDSESLADESDCECEDAESEASDSYSYGKKAYNSTTLDDLKYYSKKAMNSASSIIDEAEECEDE